VALGFADLGNAATQLEVDAVGRADRQADELSGIGGGQFNDEDLDQMPGNRLCDSRTAVVAVYARRHRASLSLLAA
jgi:hypothetical protein